jgi:DNA-binding beta-propeller fold protein YncE
MILLLQACMQDDLLWEPNGEFPQVPGRGLFIVNEGNFNYGNASLSYYNIDQKELVPDVFYAANVLPLGDVAHSMTLRDSLAYVVVNNSGRIVILHARTFKYEGKITGLTSPRYIHFLDDTKAYVSDLYARSIAIVNPQTREITGSIPVNNHTSDFYQHSTEQMLQYDQYVYVNCWSFDNKILIIDSEQDRVVDSIQVIKQPNSMVLDKYHSLWVLSDGGFEDSPYGYELPGLMRIKSGSKEVEIMQRFKAGERPSELRINGGGDTLYFINQHIYSYAVENPAGPELLISSPHEGSASGGFYTLEVDPANSQIYVADAIDHLQKGIIYRYDSFGDLLDSFHAGITPGDFCFMQPKAN